MCITMEFSNWIASPELEGISVVAISYLQKSYTALLVILKILI